MQIEFRRKILETIEKDADCTDIKWALF